MTAGVWTPVNDRSFLHATTAKPLREDEAEDQFSRSQDEIPGF